MCYQLWEWVRSRTPEGFYVELGAETNFLTTFKQKLTQNSLANPLKTVILYQLLILKFFKSESPSYSRLIYRVSIFFLSWQYCSRILLVSLTAQYYSSSIISLLHCLLLFAYGRHQFLSYQKSLSIHKATVIEIWSIFTRIRRKYKCRLSTFISRDHLKGFIRPTSSSRTRYRILKQIRICLFTLTFRLPKVCKITVCPVLKVLF